MKAKSFFCEACGKPVALKARKCPHCGRVFDSVKCPKCSFSGRPDLFSDGCPACGYLKGGKDRKGGSAGVDEAFSVIEGGLVSPESEGIAIERDGTDRPGGKQDNAGWQLPGWSYPILITVLVVVLIAILVVYIRM